MTSQKFVEPRDFAARMKKRKIFVFSTVVQLLLKTL